MVLINDSTIAKIADKTSSTVGQVLISWAVQRGTAAVPKSEKEERIKQNITVRFSTKPALCSLNLISYVSSSLNSPTRT